MAVSIEPKLFVKAHNSHDPRGRFMNAQNYKKLCPKFCKIWRCAKKNIMKSANFLFVFVLYCTKRRCSEIEAQFKVEIEEGSYLKSSTHSIIYMEVWIKFEGNYVE